MEVLLAHPATHHVGELLIGDDEHNIRSLGRRQPLDGRRHPAHAQQRAGKQKKFSPVGWDHGVVPFFRVTSGRCLVA